MGENSTGGKTVNRARRRRLQVAAAAVVLLVVAAACEAVPGDFTGDRKADEVYENYGSGTWYTAGQTTPLYTGQANDIAVPADYDGDGKWEPAVLRDKSWISSALADPIVYDPAGMPAGPPATPAGCICTVPTLVPVPGDYDGTGKTVPAYFDQVDDSWWIMGHTKSVRFGIPPVAGGNSGYDVPAPADYDGDGKTDIAVFRPTNGSFHYLSSKTGQRVNIASPAPRGYPALLPVPADYDKAGHAEAAATDLEGQSWYVIGHSGAFATFAQIPTDDQFLPAPADYDGDGMADAALIDVYNGGFWSNGGTKPPHAGSGTPYFAASYPIAIVENLVRLTFYARCLQNPSADPGVC